MPSINDIVNIVMQGIFINWVDYLPLVKQPQGWKWVERNRQSIYFLNGHGENATQKHESGMTAFSPNLSPASGREG